MSPVLTGLLVLHIAGGSIGLVAGLVAMIGRKGATLHARAGNWFFGAMMLMAVSAAVLAAVEPDRLSLLSGVLTGYLVFSSWRTARRRQGQAQLADWAGLGVALLCLSAYVHGAATAAATPGGELDGFPAPVFIAFGALAALGALTDLLTFLQPALTYRRRIARHLWRMCVAYFLAATSLFLGQQDDVFWFMAGSPVLFLPSVATLGFMAYWLIRNEWPGRKKGSA